MFPLVLFVISMGNMRFLFERFAKRNYSLVGNSPEFLYKFDIPIQREAKYLENPSTQGPLYPPQTLRICLLCKSDTWWLKRKPPFMIMVSGLVGKTVDASVVKAGPRCRDDRDASAGGFASACVVESIIRTIGVTAFITAHESCRLIVTSLADLVTAAVIL